MDGNRDQNRQRQRSGVVGLGILFPEPEEEKLERIRRFFNDRPLRQCLDDGHFVPGPFFEKLAEPGMDTIVGNLLFNRLEWETTQRASYIQGRPLVEVMRFWDDVRGCLRDEEFEFLENWPPEITNNGAAEPYHSAADVKRPEENAVVKDLREQGQVRDELRVWLQTRDVQAIRSEIEAPRITSRSRNTHEDRKAIMDPFSAEGELLNLHNYFHQGQFQEAIDFDTAGLSPENKLPARVLSLRAQIALGQAEDVIADVQGEQDVELQAVGALAELAAGNESKALKMAEKLSSESGDNATVQVLAGTVLQAAGKSEEALALLSNHQGNLEAVALIVQIHLEQNRTDLAIKEVAAARRWAQDSLLVNLAESWVGMRVGGEKYQQGFYVFEELAQAPSTSSAQSLVSQAVAEIHLGRLEEAEAALQQALAKDPKNAEGIVNSLVLNVIAGKDAKQLTSELQSVAPNHHFLVDLQEKAALFDKAATKYSAKAAA